MAFQIRSTGFPLSSTGSNDLMKVKIYSKRKRRKTQGMHIHHSYASVSLLKTNVLSSSLSLVNCNFTSATQLRISIPSEKVLLLQILPTPRFSFSLQWRVEPTSLRLRVEIQAEGCNCLVKPPGWTILVVERWPLESGRIRTPMKNWMYNNAGGIWKLLGKMSSKNASRFLEVKDNSMAAG